MRWFPAGILSSMKSSWKVILRKQKGGEGWFNPRLKRFLDNKKKNKKEKTFNKINLTPKSNFLK